jgi:DNA-binding LacI/PurR family transcriptional regulator
MAVTIVDIANKMGVSPSTVSRVINNKGNISAKTRQTVFKLMEDMQYHPNNLARGFVTQSARAIGLVINAADPASFSNTFFSRSVFAVEQAAQLNGFSLIITNDNDVPGGPSAITSLVYEKRVDGLILPSSGATQHLMKKLISDSFPFVILGKPARRRNKCSWVDVDNAQGASAGLGHLIANGYSRIAFVANNLKTVFVRDRLKGFRKELAEQGMSLRENHIVNCADDISNCTAMVSRLLSEPFPPDAFLCCDNLLAFRVMKAVQAAGRSIPHDVGLVSFDNYPLAEYTEPALTSVDVDTFRLGKTTAEILLQKIRGEISGDQRTLIPASLEIRESSVRKGGGR